MTLKIGGEGATAQQDARDLVERLKTCSGLDLKLGANGTVTEGTTAGNPPPAGGSAPIAEAVREMIASGRALRIRVRRTPRRSDPVIDRYCQRLVILDHVDAFPTRPPAAHPSATTRCEVLAHVMAEYAAALKNGQTSCEEGFDDNHQAGLDAQKRHREGAGQRDAPPHRNTEEQRNGRKCVVFYHCDGSTTVARQDPDSGAITVEHSAAPEGQKKKPLPKAPKSLKSARELFARHPFVFAGTVARIGASPGSWSNFGQAHQAVYYRHVEWLKGEARANVALVHHLCMEATLTANRARPGIDARLFGTGRRVLVFAHLATDPERKGGVRLEANEPNGFIEAGLFEAAARGKSRRPVRARG